MANYQYCVATNWGKGFVSEDDSRKILPKEYAGNIWRVIANNKDANMWIAGVDGTRKTLSEAQAIVASPPWSVVQFSIWTSTSKVSTIPVGTDALHFNGVILLVLLIVTCVVVVSQQLELFMVNVVGDKATPGAVIPTPDKQMVSEPPLLLMIKVSNKFPVVVGENVMVTKAESPCNTWKLVVLTLKIDNWFCNWVTSRIPHSEVLYT